jgi:hypothetical protein
VGADAAGDFVVAWHGEDQDGSAFGVFARRFSSAGDALAGELQVNTYTSSSQTSASIAVDADGEFVVAWQSAGRDGSGEGVFAQRFGDPIVLDIDGNGAADALTDGLLVLRYLFGFTEASLTVALSTPSTASAARRQPSRTTWRGSPEGLGSPPRGHRAR